jgi:hypothetical protein
MDRYTRILPLGFQRFRILDCLGGDWPRAQGYFDPPADTDIFKAFADHVTTLSRLWGTETDPVTVSLLAAARLLTGDLAAADAIVENLPAEPFKLMGARFCPLAPFHALSAVLPLPADLEDNYRWVEGSAEQAALRIWLAEHRDKLRWVEIDGIYLPTEA